MKTTKPVPAFLSLLVSLLVASSLAFAEEKAKPPAAAPAAAPAPAGAAPAAGAPMMPKPSPELDAAYKGMEGNWKCDTTFAPNAMGPGSPEIKAKTTIKFKKELGGF